MTTADIDVTRAREQLAEAEARAATLRQQVEQQAAREAAERDWRLLEHDWQIVAGYDAAAAALLDEVKAAEATFHAAILDTSFVREFIKFRACRLRKAGLYSHTNGAMERTGSNRRLPDLNIGPNQMIDWLVEFAGRQAGEIAGAEQEEWAAAREAAGRGEAPS